MAFLLPSIFPSCCDPTSIHRSSIHTMFMLNMDIWQKKITTIKNAWFLQTVTLKVLISHRPFFFFFILSQSNIHLALSHLVIQVFAFLQRALPGTGGFITCVMHFQWVCSCEQSLIAAEATSSLIKRSHALVGVCTPSVCGGVAGCVKLLVLPVVPFFFFILAASLVKDLPVWQRLSK